MRAGNDVRDQGLFASAGPSLGVLVFLVGAACLVAALVHPLAFLALPAGIGAVVLTVWCAVRFRNYASGTFDELFGVGIAVALVGDVLAIVGGILALTRR
jgi:hypothetical protein